MNTRQAALYLGISRYYLRNMRHNLHNHDGPRYEVRLYGRMPVCYYAIEDLDAWKANHRWRYE